jgi:hypothetical protein
MLAWEVKCFAGYHFRVFHGVRGGRVGWGGRGGNKRILQLSIHSLSQARKRFALMQSVLKSCTLFLFRFLFVVRNQTLDSNGHSISSQEYYTL